MKPFLRKICLYALTLALLGVGALLSLTLVNAIPTSAIADGARSSLEVLQAEGIPCQAYGSRFWAPDNYTDALLIDECVCVDAERPLHSALVNEYVRLEGERTHHLATLQRLEGRTDSTLTVRYARYWHGSQLFLRPLLALGDIWLVRTVNYLLVIALLAALWTVARRRGLQRAFFCILLALILTGLPLVPLSMQYMPCHVLALCAVFYLWKTHPAGSRSPNRGMFFFSSARRRHSSTC